MAEYIDVLNEDGIKTGEILTRKEVHSKGLWHRAIVIAIINEKNEILLQQTEPLFPQDFLPHPVLLQMILHFRSQWELLQSFPPHSPSSQLL